MPRWAGAGDLPDLVVEHILTHMRPTDIPAVALTCHRWRYLVTRVIPHILVRAFPTQPRLHASLAAILTDDPAPAHLCGTGSDGGEDGGGYGTATGLAPRWQAQSTALGWYLRAGTDVNGVRTADGRPALCWAAARNRVCVMRLLLTFRADPNVQCSRDAVTPLHIACELGHVDIVDVLLLAGAHVPVAQWLDATTLTPLYRAAAAGHLEVVDALLRHGAGGKGTVKAPGPAVTSGEHHPGSMTPLYAACEGGHIDIAGLLLDAGADPNLCEDGYSPLHVASFCGYGCIVHLLVGQGATVDRRTADRHKTPLFLAAQNGHDAVVNILLACGADVSLCTLRGETPLIAACRRGEDSVTNQLLAAGGCVDHRTTSGECALEIVSKKMYNKCRGHIAKLKACLHRKAQKRLDHLQRHCPASWLGRALSEDLMIVDDVGGGK